MSSGKPDGRTKRPEFSTWKGMLARCHDPKSGAFKNYGGRGISVCEEWQASFWTFLEDMGPKPGPEYSIERLDVDGDYNPFNCDWIPFSEQAKNTRKACMNRNAAASVVTPLNNIRATFKAHRGSMRRLAERLGMSEPWVSNVLSGKRVSGRILQAAEMYAAELKAR